MSDTLILLASITDGGDAVIRVLIGMSIEHARYVGTLHLHAREWDSVRSLISQVGDHEGLCLYVEQTEAPAREERDVDR
jgi:hypothetical protein